MKQLVHMRTGKTGVLEDGRLTQLDREEADQLVYDGEGQYVDLSELPETIAHGIRMVEDLFHMQRVDPDNPWKPESWA